MKKPSSRFAAAVCALVIFLSLWSIKDFYYNTAPRTAPGDAYGVTDEQARLQELIASLPADRVIGYIPDPGLDEFTRASRRTGAQYALAPRLLVLQSESPQEWVVSDFSRPMNLDGFARANGIQLVRSFANGIALFHRTGRP